MGSYKILVVDDEIDFMQTLIKRMRKRGFDVAGVESGEEAMKLIKKQDFDVVLLDVKMPQGMDGIETLRKIKKIRPLIEVVLLSGHASIERSIESKKLGAFDYLLKPIALDDLLIKLSAAFKNKEKSTF